jgi:hypothetical protein
MKKLFIAMLVPVFSMQAMDNKEDFSLNNYFSNFSTHYPNQMGFSESYINSSDLKDDNSDDSENQPSKPKTKKQKLIVFSKFPNQPKFSNSLSRNESLQNLGSYSLTSGRSRNIEKELLQNSRIGDLPSQKVKSIAKSRSTMPRRSTTNTMHAKRSAWIEALENSEKKRKEIVLTNASQQEEIPTINLIALAKSLREQLRHANRTVGQEEMRVMLQAMIAHIQQQHAQPSQQKLALSVPQLQLSPRVNIISKPEQHSASVVRPVAADFARRAMRKNNQGRAQLCVTIPSHRFGSTQSVPQQVPAIERVTIPQLERLVEIVIPSAQAREEHADNLRQVHEQLHQHFNPHIIDPIIEPQPDPIIIPIPQPGPQPAPQPQPITPSFFARNKRKVITTGIIGALGATGFAAYKLLGLQAKQIKTLNAVKKAVLNAQAITLNSVGLTRLTKENQQALLNKIDAFNAHYTNNKVKNLHQKIHKRAILKDLQKQLIDTINRCVAQIKNKPVRNVGLLSTAADNIGALCINVKDYVSSKLAVLKKACIA